MTHHHHDHERYDRVQFDQEQKLVQATQLDTVSMSELVRGMRDIKRKERPRSPGSARVNGR